ncbi:MAG: hypothetical protein A3F42_06690 [Gammaproteobacteria bacterium RIFCSPHIGHO2_12_FULL_37_34]|nr:MAG: hypothetical protein A3F42_06690 [Gammaproteobacteria bacterium RIFCSPHIGHO2_12_FULL_37_34]
MFERVAKEPSSNVPISFSTKANTLDVLQGKIIHANILPLFFFTAAEWRHHQPAVVEKIRHLSWINQALILRSSAQGEDSQHTSLAGCFTSVMRVRGEVELIRGIETVIASYGNYCPDHQVLIQPFLENINVSGVAFGRDPNTCGPYIIINYDDSSGLAESITSGTQAENKCFIWHRHSERFPGGFIQKVILLLQELEEIFLTDLLDIEFAVTNDQHVYLFQVRPLILKEFLNFSSEEHALIIKRIADRITVSNKPHLYLYGARTVYGVMPDWNPAEIIGIRPRPLALSLYRNLITDSIWAYQRDNYGYNNLRSFPLLIDFEGLPYVDVRVSFNSFLPKGLSPDLAERLVNYYMNRLIESPSLHDKVEFDIVFSCYTLDLKERLKILTNYNFDDKDQDILFCEITQLTNCIIHNNNGLWKNDLDKINELERRQQQLFASDLDPISKMYWILEDCKRYGTLPFAGLARAGFIAVQLLKSFVTVGIINQHEYSDFFSSLDSIGSRINRDFHLKSKEEFLQLYGHLRPGTYDILSLRYDESPDVYFDWNAMNTSSICEKSSSFFLSINQLRSIQQHIDCDHLQTTVLELLEFIKIAIESREYSKFIFTRSVSEFLKILSQFSERYELTRQDCSYLNTEVIYTLYRSTVDPQKILQQNIQMGKEQYLLSKSIALPPLLCDASDAWFFHYPEILPNFITQKSCSGHVVFADAPKDRLIDGILFIPSADPGFDWIFSHQISGFVTQFGGVNSHMAIRAGELGIPAVIGAGEACYAKWSKAKRLRIDAENKQVIVL